MRNEWIELDREGWYRCGAYTYEYLAEAPTENLAHKRKAKGVVHANMKYQWVADIASWENERTMRSKQLGVFKEDCLDDAMGAVEKWLSQLNMFQS